MSAPNSAGYVTDVAYVPGFYPHLAPKALRHVAILNRIKPPAVADGFKYLELGCGLGRTLTTLAAANPRGSFVGVDLNPQHTAQIARDIEVGGLSNARIVTSDFSQLPDDLRDFDFITLHGVWSWVAPDVRTDILRIASERLSPGGLLLLSYNAMPGWAHLQPIRGILRQYAALRQGDSVQRARDAVNYLAYMRDQKAKYFVDNPNAAAYVDTIRGQDPRYLAHEYLNEHWTSFYFAEVAGQFAEAGLSFVGSLPVHTNFWDLCVAPVFHDLFRTTTNRLVTEAHKDFCANTMFRWDVYGKQPTFLPDASPRARRSLGPQSQAGGAIADHRQSRRGELHRRRWPVRHAPRHARGPWHADVGDHRRSEAVVVDRPRDRQGRRCRGRDAVVRGFVRTIPRDRPHRRGDTDRHAVSLQPGDFGR